MTLVYSLSAENWCDYFEAITPRLKNLSNYYLNILSTNGLLLAFAYFCIADLNLVIIGICAAYFGVHNLAVTIPYSRLVRASIKRQALAKLEHQIILEITDLGLKETAFDIVSFCPWSSVETIQTSNTVVIISLTSGLYATVPLRALEQLKMNQQDFILFLDSKKLAIRAQHGAAATS